MREQKPLALKVHQQEAEEVKIFSPTLEAASQIRAQLNGTSNHISMKHKLSLYNCLVIPVAIYASETWKSNNNLAHKLDVLHHRCLRKLLKVSW